MGNLTINFSDWEFDCKDGTKVPDELKGNRDELAANLQILRNFIGKPIKINSSYRTPEHNKSIGGASRSQHVQSKAADIAIKGLTPKQVYDTIEELQKDGKMKQGGLGLYNTFVHYDIRGTKARWDYRK